MPKYLLRHAQQEKPKTSLGYYIQTPKLRQKVVMPSAAVLALDLSLLLRAACHSQYDNNTRHITRLLWLAIIQRCLRALCRATPYRTKQKLEVVRSGAVSSRSAPYACPRQWKSSPVRRGAPGKTSRTLR